MCPAKRAKRAARVGTEVKGEDGKAGQDKAKAAEKVALHQLPEGTAAIGPCILDQVYDGIVIAERGIQDNKNNKKVLVDPKGSDYSKYKGAYLLTPNKKIMGHGI